jgi:hypothetical protein
MKKMFGVLAILILSIGFFGCSNGTTDLDDDDDDDGTRTATLIIKNNADRTIGKFTFGQEPNEYGMEEMPWSAQSDTDIVVKDNSKTFSITLLEYSNDATKYRLGFLGVDYTGSWDFAIPYQTSGWFTLPAGSTKTLTIDVSNDGGTPYDYTDDVFSIVVSP